MKKHYAKSMFAGFIFLLMYSFVAAQGNYEYPSPCYGGNADPTAIQEYIDNYQPRVYRSNIAMPDGWTVESLMPVNRSQIDNKGTEFWLLMPRNHDLVVSGIYLDITCDVNTSGTVSIPGLSFNEAFTAGPGSITRVTLPNDVQVATSQGIEQKGIHVISQHEVAVYGVSLRPYSSDGYLGLPLDILSTQYLIMSYPNLTWGGITPNAGLLSQFAIVSPYDNVTVTITPSCETYGGNPAGVPFQVGLNQGEVYQVQCYVSNDPGADLTGSVVQSTLPVAVISGNACASVPQNVSACDHILEQIPPVSTWGSSFVAYPLEGRENGDTWRMLAASDNTSLYIDGVLVVTLNFGDFYETILTAPAEITASHPVIVMQYSNGDDFDPGISQNGDPFMMLIPPTEQFMDHYTFATPSSGFIYHYVTVTIETGGIATLQLDGVNVDPGLFTPIGSTGFSGAGLSIAEGPHTLQNTSGVPFGIYSYGFAEYDSYGYAGGLSLNFIYTGSAPVITRTSQTINLENSGQPENTALNIETLITDPEAPFTQSAILYYKEAGTATYTQVNMTEGANNIWSAQIPAMDVVTPGIHYYLYAEDGQLASTDPTLDPGNNPYSIAVLPNVLPVITHTAVSSAPLNQDLTLNADVTDFTNIVHSVTLYDRNKGGNPVYSSAAMLDKGAYQGIIPALFMTNQGTEYYIKATDDLGLSSTFATADQPIVINAPFGIGDLEENTHPHLSVFPNPTSGNASIEIIVDSPAMVSLRIYNNLGEEVNILIDQKLSGGTHQFDFAGSQYPAGIYFCYLKIGNSAEIMKLIITND